MSERFVAAIDQGTTSSRCIIVDADSHILAFDQREHRAILPRPGWVEHDPVEIVECVRGAMVGALMKGGIEPSQIVALGVSNQRETTVVWERATGRPVYNAITWQDIRTDALCAELSAEIGPERVRAETGLPLASYFSAPKIRWLLDEIPGLRERAEAGELLFGTMDSWLIWNLTGGIDGGVHATDVTNASRTLLMNLQTLDWDERLLAALEIPRVLLPEIRSSAEVYGTARGPMQGVPIAAAMGNQQAALFGQTCFAPGEAKSTYDTGGFLLLNTGEQIVPSQHGLLTTVAYQIGTDRPVFALEGAMANTGSATRWLRDRLGVISTVAEVETLALTVTDNGGCHFVPAFSGLFTPYWQPDARGVITGLTDYVGKGHLARAALEATAWQTREVMEAIVRDTGRQFAALKVDGAMTANSLLMQTIADVLDVPVIRSLATETSCLGAAYAAGLVAGRWPDLDALRDNWHRAAEWTPQMSEPDRDREYRKWLKAVERAKGSVATPSAEKRRATDRTAMRSSATSSPESTE
jgi:glycerol kinase